MLVTTLEDVQTFLNSRKHLGIKPGLSRMTSLLTQVGNPEKWLKAVHIAGTNGKGSTLAYMRSCLINSGYKVGSFTSPHNQLTNHININNLPIDESEIVTLTNRLIPVVKSLDIKGDNPSEFEILVVIAILYMYQEKVDIALFEAGMGGLEDSTNCIDPMLSIITSIGLDHTKFLGDSIEEIAHHKAGIIKRGVPVIVGEMKDSAYKVVAKKARANSSQVYHFGRDFFVQQRDLGVFNFCIPPGETISLSISMKGTHQIHNAALACMGLIELRKQGFYMKDEHIKGGMKDAINPGRFEIINQKPLVILDGAHNKEGIEVFLHTVKNYYPASKKHILFAAFKDKPLKDMVENIEAEFDDVVFTTFEHPRAASEQELYNFSTNEQSRCTSDWKKAIQTLLTECDDNGVICLTGSLYFIELTRNYLLDILKKNLE